MADGGIGLIWFCVFIVLCMGKSIFTPINRQTHAM